MRVQFNYVFDRKNKVKKPSQKGLIELRAYQNPSAKYVSTKIEVRKEEWNEIKQEVKTNHPDADDLNIQLRKLKSDVNDKQTEYCFKGKPFTLDDVKAHFKNKRLKTSSFIVFMREELTIDNSLKQKTKTQHYNSIKKLLDFNNNNDILFNDISFGFVSDFINYLRSKKFAVNTIHKQHKNLKKYINLAIKKGYIDISNPCNDLAVKSEQKPRDILTFAELTKVEQLEIEEIKIEQVRQMFLFACYTGLRISDVCGLKTEYVKELEKGLELNFFTLKVNKHAVIPLYKLFTVKDSKSKPEQILIKYLDREKEFVFPKLSEAYINRHLKVIALNENVGITFNLTFHIARETFGTYMANKVSLPTLQILMQHSDIKTTMRYVHLSKQLIEEQLIKVDWD